MSELAQLTKAIVQQNALLMKQHEMLTKAPAAFNTALPLHGNGGLFSTPGLDNAILSTHVSNRGLGGLLPAFPTTETNPSFGFIVGFSDDIGTEPVNACDDAPVGYMTTGSLTARFGKVTRQTNTIEISRVLEKLHRGDFTDLILRGNLMNEGMAGIQYPANMDAGSFMDAVIYSEMVGAGVRMERKLAKMFWTGDPANGNGGGYKEFPGMDQQVATGQLDAETGALLAAADSIVDDANYAVVGSSTFDLVARVQEVEHYLTALDEDTFGDVQRVVVMRPELWKVVSEVWPIQYNTQHGLNVLSGNTSAQLMVDGGTMVTERDQMRNGFYIDINGKRYPVVLDTGIYEANGHAAHLYNDANLSPGQYASSMYFLPLTAGGLPVLYWQYKDWSQLAPYFGVLGGKENFWSDGGRFLWGYNDTGSWCFNLKFTTEPRVVLRTPQLSARIDNLVYAPGIKMRDPDPANPHWVGGGVSTRTAPSQSAVWL